MDNISEEKYKNKYRIESARLLEYDYAQDGMYFVTICTRGREHFFGEITNCEMNLSDIGKIVQAEWLQTAIIRQNVILDEWIIMPNHVHMIVEITNQSIVTQSMIVETPRWGVCTNDARGVCMPNIASDVIVETPPITETPQRGVSTRGGHNPQWKPNSLGSIINQFKSVCTKRIWKSGFMNFAWQTRFYDHIIRDDESLNKIRAYIQNNPNMWEQDRNNLENLMM